MADSSKPASGLAAAEPTESIRSVCLNDELVLEFAAGRLSQRERERIHKHLDECGLCCELVGAAAQSRDVTLSEVGTAFATAFGAGTLIAQRYEVRRFIARGGMGEVYEAYDRQLQERVAVKTLPSTACDSEVAIRDFKNEVQLARRVTHPNVCRIYDLGTHTLSNGTLLYFLTMEFVPGQTLGRLIRERGPLPLATAEQFGKALLNGLSAAHAAGILHRDFKSDNIILRAAPDGESTPVILDFGLARSLDERSRRNSERGLVGTFQYMAPEQLQAGPLTTATDVYAFGVVWFEMLTGQLPFSGPPQLSALERLHKNPPPPSRLNPALPEHLDAIVSRCLSRSPADRFQTAEDVLAALSRAAPQRPVARGRSMRTLRALLAVALLGILSGGATLTVQRRRASRAPATAQRPLPLVQRITSASTSAVAVTTTPSLARELPTRESSERSSLGARSEPPAKRAGRVMSRPHPSGALASAAAPAANAAPAAAPSASSRFPWANPMRSR